jgi:hypothetical protein
MVRKKNDQAKTRAAEAAQGVRSASLYTGVAVAAMLNAQR